MKKWLTEIILFSTAALMFFASYVFSLKAFEQEERQGVFCPESEPCYTIHHTPEELDYLDAAWIASLVLGCSSVVAGVWLVHKRRYPRESMTD